MIEVFVRFLWLGCVSFGGPVAHIAYFRTSFVEQRQWLTEQQFMTRLSLCNLLPGPSSSQLGFAIGHHRAGLPGAIAAFLGFTLPSFLIMFGLATFIAFADYGQLDGLIAGGIFGLKLAAVVIVTDAVLTMFLTFCRSYFLAGLAAVALILFMFPLSGINPIAWMLAGGLIHYWYYKVVAARHNLNPNPDQVTAAGSLTAAKGALMSSPAFKQSCFAGLGFCVLFAVPIFSAFVVNAETGFLANLFSSFYQVGASTMGGGHVVLPLLFEHFSGLVDKPVLLSAYSSAQALPGPMFTIATFLGVEITQDHGSYSSLFLFLASVVATLGIFLPGFLLLTMMLPIWDTVSKLPGITSFLSGINAVVVGLLASALFLFVVPGTLLSWQEYVFAISVFGLLCLAKLPMLAVLSLCVAYGLAQSFLYLL